MEQDKLLVTVFQSIVENAEFYEQIIKIAQLANTQHKDRKKNVKDTIYSMYTTLPPCYKKELLLKLSNNIYE